jgi:hypothetical protein
MKARSDLKIFLIGGTGIGKTVFSLRSFLGDPEIQIPKYHDRDRRLSLIAIFPVIKYSSQ